MTEEIWKDIGGEYKGIYSVSNLGNVRSESRLLPSSRGRFRLTKTQLLKPGKNRDGYLLVAFSKNGAQRSFSIHRLVALAFIPNPKGKPCVNHLDFDRANNRVENLEWCFRDENIAHSRRHGRMPGLTPIPDDKIAKIRELLSHGFSQQKTARLVGVHQTTVWKYSKASPHSD